MFPMFRLAQRIFHVRNHKFLNYSLHVGVLPWDR